jgi:hypothetical protein
LALDNGAIRWTNLRDSNKTLAGEHQNDEHHEQFLLCFHKAQ